MTSPLEPLDQAIARGRLRTMRDADLAYLAVAVGNGGDPEARAALAERSPDRPSAEDEMVQEHVAWALDQVKSQKSKVKS